jgi:pimeloyl-ACP methyl ester carboxylesterase
MHRLIKHTIKLHALLLLACVCSCRSQINPQPLPLQTEGARYLLLVVHGSGDTAAGWPADVIQKVEKTIARRELWDLVAYDWSTYAASKATASKAGLEIGNYIGERLSSADYHYERIQLVGHSAGAFVVQGACDAYRANSSNTARMHLTFLDPFTGNGFIDWTYGKRRFGLGADFAEAYINTDDPVPSTNGTLSKAHNFDVTAQAPASLAGADRHWWPVYFYLESIDKEDEMYGYPLSLMATGEGAPTQQAQFPIGETTVVP